MHYSIYAIDIDVLANKRRKIAMEFKKDTLFGNIIFLLKEQGKRIGEFEADTGVSPGYISRASKEGNAKPGIDFIMKAAEILNVSLDTLLGTDISELTPTEKYLVSFLKKLENDTNNDKLDWQVETADYLNHELDTDMDGDCCHPLFELERDKSGYLTEVRNLIFSSRSYGNSTHIAGKCFNHKLKDSSIYIMYITTNDAISKKQDEHSIEIWICKNRGANRFLCSTKETPVISGIIENLYSAISEDTRHPKIPKDIKAIIDSFMKGDDSNSYDIDALPF